MLDGVPVLLMIVISIPHTKCQYFANNQYFSDKKFQYFSSPSPQVASLSCWLCADGITMYHVEPQLLLPAVLTLHTLETLIMEKSDVVKQGKFEIKKCARNKTKSFLEQQPCHIVTGPCTIRTKLQPNLFLSKVKKREK